MKFDECERCGKRPAAEGGYGRLCNECHGAAWLDAHPWVRAWRECLMLGGGRSLL